MKATLQGENNLYLSHFQPIVHAITHDNTGRGKAYDKNICIPTSLISAAFLCKIAPLKGLFPRLRKGQVLNYPVEVTECKKGHKSHSCKDNTWITKAETSWLSAVVVI